jgi:hypothetical protein
MCIYNISSMCNASFVYADKFEAVGGIIALGKV